MIQKNKVIYNKSVFTLFILFLNIVFFISCGSTEADDPTETIATRKNKPEKSDNLNKENQPNTHIITTNEAMAGANPPSQNNLSQQQNQNVQKNNSQINTNNEIQEINNNQNSSNELNDLKLKLKFKVGNIKNDQDRLETPEQNINNTSSNLNLDQQKQFIDQQNRNNNSTNLIASNIINDDGNTNNNNLPNNLSVNTNSNNNPNKDANVSNNNRSQINNIHNINNTNTQNPPIRSNIKDGNTNPGTQTSNNVDDNYVMDENKIEDEKNDKKEKEIEDTSENNPKNKIRYYMELYKDTKELKKIRPVPATFFKLLNYFIEPEMIHKIRTDVAQKLSDNIQCMYKITDQTSEDFMEPKSVGNLILFFFEEIYKDFYSNKEDIFVIKKDIMNLSIAFDLDKLKTNKDVINENKEEDNKQLTKLEKDIDNILNNVYEEYRDLWDDYDLSTKNGVDGGSNDISRLKFVQLFHFLNNKLLWIYFTRALAENFNRHEDIKNLNNIIILMNDELSKIISIAKKNKTKEILKKTFLFVDFALKFNTFINSDFRYTRIGNRLKSKIKNLKKYRPTKPKIFNKKSNNNNNNIIDNNLNDVDNIDDNNPNNINRIPIIIPNHNLISNNNDPYNIDMDVDINEQDNNGRNISKPNKKAKTDNSGKKKVNINNINKKQENNNDEKDEEDDDDDDDDDIELGFMNSPGCNNIEPMQD